MNTIKHAEADKVHLLLIYPFGSHDTLQLKITDNGTKNIRITPKKGHFGIHYMKESAHAIGAQIEFTTTESGGCCISILLPIRSGCTLKDQYPQQRSVSIL